jgi:hypothetical protein
MVWNGASRHGTGAGTGRLDQIVELGGVNDPGNSPSKRMPQAFIAHPVFGAHSEKPFLRRDNRRAIPDTTQTGNVCATAGGRLEYLGIGGFGGGTHMTARVTLPEPIEIGIVEKNSREHVVVSLSEFRGHQLVDVRVHASVNGVEERHPTKKGISINVERLPELIAVLQGAERKAIELGLLGDRRRDRKPAKDNGTEAAPGGNDFNDETDS